MTIRKIEAGRVITKDLDTFVGQEGTLFYDELTGEFRLSDGITPGGIRLSTGGGNATLIISPVAPTGAATGTLWWNDSDGNLYVRYDLTWVPAIITTEGPRGIQGTVGPAGPTGPQGNAGPTGPQGNAGPTGPQGNAGPTGSNTIISNTAPIGAVEGTFWWNDSDGNLYVRYDNTWIPAVVTTAGPVGAAGPAGATGPAGTTGSNIALTNTAPVGAPAGALWWDPNDGNLYVRYDTTWVPATPSIPYTLPTASTSTLGGFRVGRELSISNTGTLNVDLSAVTQAIIPNIDAEYSLGTPELRWKDIHVSTGSVYIGDLKLSNDTGTLLLGTSAQIDLDPYTIIRGERDVNNYATISVRNVNTGNNASADIILYQGGNDADHYADLGIASDNYSYPGYSVIEAGDTYLFGRGGNVKIGTASSGTDVVFFTGGVDSLSSEIARFKDGQGLVLKGNLTFSDGSTQSSAGGSSLQISEINSDNSLTNTVTNVTAIRFDRDTGFNVTDLGAGEVKVSLGSSFKTWQVEGQEDVVAVGEDTVEFKAGDGITLTTNPTAPNKSITIASNMFWASRNW